MKQRIAALCTLLVVLGVLLAASLVAIALWERLVIRPLNHELVGVEATQ